MPEFDPDKTPNTVIAAAAAGTVVVPFLIVYSFLFIARGAFVHVDQPDITSSRAGEAAAGVAALVFLMLACAGIGRLLNGRGRWLFLAVQFGTLAACVRFLFDTSSGARQVPLVVGVAAILGIVLALVPVSWAWVAEEGGDKDFVAVRIGESPAVRGGEAPADPADTDSGLGLLEHDQG